MSDPPIGVAKAHRPLSHSIECDECFGTGRYWRRNQYQDSYRLSHDYCRFCDGTGTIDREVLCEACGDASATEELGPNAYCEDCASGRRWIAW